MLLRLLATACLAAGLAGWLALRGPAPLHLGEAAEGWLLGGGGGLFWLGAAAAAVLTGISRRRVRRTRILLLAAALAAAAALALRPPGRPARAAWTGAAAEHERGVLWVGVDAFTWARALPLVRQGRLPNLARLLREGAHDVLLSEATYRPSTGETGYWSPVVWTTLATGVGAGRHGIDDFIIRRQGGAGREGRRARGRPAASHHRRVPAFWNIYGQFGRPVGVVGWWASWPAERILGVMASSHLGLRGALEAGAGGAGKPARPRAAALTWPAAFAEVVEGLAPAASPEELAASLGVPAARSVADIELRGTLASVLWQDELYLRIARHLLEREELALVAVYFDGIDATSHGYWLAAEDPSRLDPAQLGPDQARAAPLVDRSYEAFDRQLGELLAAAGEGTTVILCSDHGFRTFEEEGGLRGDHSGLGALLLRGPGIRAGYDGMRPLEALASALHGRPRVHDVLPTILYLQGLPVSEELEGRVLYRWLEPGLRRRQPELRLAAYAPVARGSGAEADALPEEEAEYRERLEALGYVE